MLEMFQADGRMCLTYDERESIRSEAEEERHQSPEHNKDDVKRVMVKERAEARGDDDEQDADDDERYGQHMFPIEAVDQRDHENGSENRSD